MNRSATENFIHENFGGIVQDFPWADTPDYAVISTKYDITRRRVKNALAQFSETPQLFLRSMI